MNRRFIFLWIVVIVCFASLYFFLSSSHSSHHPSKRVLLYNGSDSWHDLSYHQRIHIKSNQPTEWTISIKKGETQTYVENEKNRGHLKKFEEAVDLAASDEADAYTWVLTILLISLCFFLYRKEWLNRPKHVNEGLIISVAVVLYLGVVFYTQALPASYSKEDAGDEYYDLVVESRK